MVMPSSLASRSHPLPGASLPSRKRGPLRLSTLNRLQPSRTICLLFSQFNFAICSPHRFFCLNSCLSDKKFRTRNSNTYPYLHLPLVFGLNGPAEGFGQAIGDHELSVAPVGGAKEGETAGNVLVIVQEAITFSTGRCTTCWRQRFFPLAV
jgi:hypothetical protein